MHKPLLVAACIFLSFTAATKVAKSEEAEPPSPRTSTATISLIEPIAKPLDFKAQFPAYYEQKAAEEARIAAEKAEHERLAALQLQKEKEEAERKKQAAQDAAIALKHAEADRELAQQKKAAVGSSEQSYVKVIGTSSEQCMIYVQRVTNSRKVSGYAGNVASQGNTPVVGAIALEKNYGHVSVVVAIEGDYVILHDANWVKGAITERKVLKSTQRGYVY